MMIQDQLEGPVDSFCSFSDRLALITQRIRQRQSTHLLYLLGFNLMSVTMRLLQSTLLDENVSQ